VIEGVLAGLLVCAAAAAGAAAFRLRSLVDVRTRVGIAAPEPAVRSAWGWVARIGGSRPLRGAERSGLAERIRAAGWDRSADELVGLRVVAAAGAAWVLLGLPWPAPMMAPIVAVAARRLPDVLLARAAAERRREAARELPDVLDLLAAAATAGVPGPLALRRAASVTGGPLSADLRGAFEAVDLGSRWRAEVDEVARRFDLDELRRVTAAIVRGEALGSTMADALRTLADDVREARRAAASDRARRAPVKMLFPLVFLVLPAFLLLTVVPVLVTTMRSIR
jgi:tight adherence protein C